MLTIAMLSRWHVHAPEYAKQLTETPDCKLTAVWNEDAAAGRAWADELQCAYVDTMDAVLRDPAIQAVVVNAPTNTHTDMIIKACDAGKAVFTEKVLAPTLEEAHLIAQAIKRNHTCFGISFPHKCNPEIRKAKEYIDAGKLGQITYARVRNVHDGAIAGWLPEHFYSAEQCCGGAMIDLGAHPMYTLAWLLGRPQSVQSAFTNVTGHAVEDNAVSLLTFPGGVLGVSETGFVSKGNPYTLEVSGTKGCLMIHNGLQVNLGDGWHMDTDLQPKPESPLRQWVHACNTGAEIPEFDISQALLLSEMMERAYESSRTGRAVSFPEMHSL
ncbi:MAG: Gfo/Idh/MocA family oxidoreductase [Clostridia bacterium]